MDNNKTFIIMIIMVALFFGFYSYSYFTKKKNPQPEQEQIIPEKKDISSSKSDINISDDKKVIDEDADNLFEFIEIPQEVKYDLTFENEEIKVDFSQEDACIKHAYVKHTFQKKDNPDSTDIVSPNNDYDGALRLKFGSWDKDITLAKLTNGKDLYHFVREKNKFIFTVKFKKRDDAAVYTIKKIFEFIDGENYFLFHIEMYNDKNNMIQFDNSDFAYSVGWGPFLGLASREKIVNKRHVNTFSFLKDKNKGTKLITVKENNKDYFKLNGDYYYFATEKKTPASYWLASNGHYFATVMDPIDENKSKSYSYFFDYRDKDNKNYYCGFSRNNNSGYETDSEYNKLKSTFMVLIFAKTEENLKKYSNLKIHNYSLQNIKKIKFVRSFLFAAEIGSVIGKVLIFIYDHVSFKNYGLAIILLTLLIKLILLPLTYKSLQSQQKLSKIQPKIKELQEKFKEKPEQLNKETMKLYKKEGVNPLGGCLPMLLQMPILIAMYQLLNGMVELKGASFLWIKDLSLPDAVYVFPDGFTIPLLNMSSINILPFIMVGMQIVSSLFMTDTKSNKQAQMMMWMMPLMFFFIFYNVSSGLVLYWTIMNIFTTAQNLLIKGINKPKTA